MNANRDTLGLAHPGEDRVGCRDALIIGLRIRDFDRSGDAVNMAVHLCEPSFGNVPVARLVKAYSPRSFPGHQAFCRAASLWRCYVAVRIEQVSERFRTAHRCS